MITQYARCISYRYYKVCHYHKAGSNKNTSNNRNSS